MHCVSLNSVHLSLSPTDIGPYVLPMPASSTMTDVYIEVLHYQVVGDSPGGATSCNEMSKLAYYRQ